MAPLPPSHTRARRWSVAALGGLVVLVTLAFTALVGGPPATLALSLSVPVAVSVALVGFGVWLLRTGYAPPEVQRIAAWCVGGFLVLGVLGAWEAYLHVLEGDPLRGSLHQLTINGATGAGLGAIIGYYDVRQRRQRRLAERVQNAVEAAMDGMAILDADGRYVLANQAHADVYGYDDPETFIGETWHMCYTDEETAWFEEEVMPALFEQGQWRGEAVGHRSDGSTFPQGVSLTTVEDGGFVCVVRDITERKQRERDLEQYEAIVEAAPDPIYALDDEEQFTLANDELLEWVGCSREELVGSHPSKFTDEAVVEAIEDHIETLLVVGDRQGTIELPVSMAGGRRLVQFNVALLLADGEFQGTVGVARDISDLRERDHRLTVLDRVLRHNLRNKMNVILAHAEAVAEETADAGLEAHAATIERAGDQLLELSDDARRFEDCIEVARATATPTEIVERVTQVVDTARADHPEADITADLPEEAWARAPNTLDLALAELVANAIEHNDSDRPTVRVSVTVEGDEVAVRVADDGPGFGDMERRTLLRGTEEPLEHTQGLGLWLVRWTATGAGGVIDIEANDPRGSVVTLRLPRTEPDARAVDIEEDGGADE